ncbi:small nucleolar ribonucleoprotein complex subunit [Zalerion maritima]|uniref:Small nucleolar ribonucleoprotein complex subunit n=1 Tax=Zalerion maritima TaxID=339359 RepID=A0AAD5RNK3_9PEZI|nr:small nucleolar ribonucleoprotein complex subunit [Zalerion maritima]
MASKSTYKTTFEVGQIIRPIYTGGPVALSENAKLLVTSLGEDAILTDLSTGDGLGKVEGDGEVITNIALSPDAATLVLCSRSLSMRIYSLTKDDNGSLEPAAKRFLKPHSTPVSVTSIDRTGSLLATGGKDGLTKVWDIQKGHLTHNLHGPGVPISSLKFFETPVHKDSKKRKSGDISDSVDTRLLLGVGYQDGKVRVFDLHKGSVIAKLDSHVSSVQAIDYSQDQNALVTGSRDKTIIWWDTRSWKLRKVQPVFDMVESAGFIRDGRVSFSAGLNGCLRLWETDTGRELTQEQTAKAEENAIVSAIYRPSREFILCVQVDRTLAFYHTPEIQEHPPLPTLPPVEPFRWISGTHDEVIDLAYLLRDRSAMALATNSEDIRIVAAESREPDLNNPKSTAAYFGQDIGILKGHDQIVISLDVDWSGHWVATGAKDNTARLWKVDVESGEFTCYATFAGHAQSVSAVGLPKTIPPESSAAYRDPLNHPPSFIITGSEDQTVKRWDVSQSGPEDPKVPARARFTKKAHDKDINALDIHHAAQLFASASQDKTVKIWSTQEGEVQGILRGHNRGVWSVRFAPKGTPIIQGEQGPAAGKGTILTGSGDKTVKIWNLSDYTCLRTFEGHTHSILKVAWLKMPAGEENKRPLLCASAGGDGLVRVWNVNTGESECTLDNHEDRVWTLAVHPDTNTIVSGSADSTVTFWKDTTSETQAAQAEAAIQLVEQEQELENHIHEGSYREAITLALQLNHPGRLLSILSSVVTTDKPEPGSLCGLKVVDEVLSNLSDEQIFLLLLRLRDWNTNARTSPVAQTILWTLVRSYPASRFVSLQVRGAKGHKSVKEVIHGLLVYSERHYKRMEELHDESFILEYTLQHMGTLFPVQNGKGRNGVDTDGDVMMF